MKNLTKFSLPLMLFLSCLFVFSCSKDVINESNVEKTENELISSESVKKNNLIQFAQILSRAVYKSEDLRVFLKTEALRMFDKNYDILYYPIRNKKVSGNLSFRDILVQNSSSI